VTIQIETVTRKLLLVQLTTAVTEAAKPGGEAVEYENDDFGTSEL
jgi:hypothetical protein